MPGLRFIIAKKEKGMSDVVERLERFAKEGAGVAVLIDAAAEIRQLRAEVERLAAIRTAGNPYPHGSELFVAFEQARSPAFA